ncbi:MAG: 16S rRNA (adenine(1518)-N(6)/adenine(1519)-N(6))-dimethyltransferase RsmA [bacterium]|nr:16S rRNA (adenine(1518)-N(6)/adenine(1519)-N(6))-dimethyltransferase RsmA [bacterium]
MKQKYQAPHTPDDIKDVLEYFKIKLNKDFGQNFLIDPEVVEVMALACTKTDTILEVGPGLGILTEQLVARSNNVIAVELDSQLEPILLTLETQYNNLSIVRGDILKTDLSKQGLNNGSFAIVASLPYQITSKFLRNMLTLKPYPAEMILLIQKEVAERIVVKPGKMSVLSLSVQVFADVEIVTQVPRESFFPSPRVDSAVIAIRNIRSKQIIDVQQEKLFFQLIKTGFAHKRKKLANNLKNLVVHNKKISEKQLDQLFIELGLEANVRAQQLSLDDWKKMVDKLESFVI